MKYKLRAIVKGRLDIEVEAADDAEALRKGWDAEIFNGLQFDSGSTIEILEVVEDEELSPEP